MFEQVLNGLINSGPIGGVLAVMLYMNWKMVQRLFKVIETNTAALVGNKEALHDLKEAQQARRKEFN